MRINNFLTLIVSIIVLAVLFKILIRLLPLILLIALGFYLFKKPGVKEGQVSGQIYKQCGYCKKKADRKALSCDFCGRPLE